MTTILNIQLIIRSNDYYIYIYIYNVSQLHTPPQSSDLNPIEHLWSILDAIKKDAIKKRHISNREDLKTALQEEFISPTITRKLELMITGCNQCQELSLQNIKLIYYPN